MGAVIYRRGCMSNARSWVRAVVANMTTILPNRSMGTWTFLRYQRFARTCLGNRDSGSAGYYIHLLAAHRAVVL